jgi:hypothetical protein
MSLRAHEAWAPQQTEWNGVAPTPFESRFRLEETPVIADEAAVAVGGLQTIISWPQRETGADLLG